MMKLELGSEIEKTIKSITSELNSLGFPKLTESEVVSAIIQVGLNEYVSTGELPTRLRVAITNIYKNK